MPEAEQSADLRDRLRVIMDSYSQAEMLLGRRSTDQWLTWMVDEIRDYFTRESVVQAASVELWGRECEVSDMAEVVIRTALNEVFGPEGRV